MSATDTPLEVDGLAFTFPGDWQVTKYDDWAFYRRQFSRQFDGIKGVDILALTPEKIAFLIEVKDYRHPGTTPPSQLPQAIADKVVMTLAALLPAKLHASVSGEKNLARKILACRQLRVVVHIALPRSKQPIAAELEMNTRQKLTSLLRAIDPHPKVWVNRSSGLGWAVA